jgi:hypothetical protein
LRPRTGRSALRRGLLGSVGLRDARDRRRRVPVHGERGNRGRQCVPVP